MFDTVTIELQGADQDSMLGAQYLKHKVFSFERRRRQAMLGGGGGGGPGARSPENVLKKIVQFGAF